MKFTTVPTNGTLKADGVVVTAGQVVSLQSIPAGETWTARDQKRRWTSISSSADGKKLVAGVIEANPSDSLIYTSTDYGATWTNLTKVAGTWVSLASSADGTRLVAADSGGFTQAPATGGRMYVSSDSGASWTSVLGGYTWTGVASSADGIKVVASAQLTTTPSGTAGQTGLLLTSSDGGLSWNPGSGTGSLFDKHSWQSVASSADGQNLAAVETFGNLSLSTDSGATWRPYRDAFPPTGFNLRWSSIVSSADGRRLVAAVLGGNIYTSNDSGVTWAARFDKRSWLSLASSADGARLAAVEQNGQIYTSADSGLSWGARESTRDWRSIASSMDGTRLAAVAYDGQIYTSTGARAEVVTYTAAASGRDNFSFQVEDDGADNNLDLSPNAFAINVASNSVPSVASLIRNNSEVTVTFSGVLDSSYRVQYAEGVGPNFTWKEYIPSVVYTTRSEGLFSFTEAQQPGAVRVYRAISNP